MFVRNKTRGCKRSRALVVNLGEKSTKFRGIELLDNRGLSPLYFGARKSSAPLQRIIAGAGSVIQRRNYYAYGGANTIPHIHVYSGGDCHLKIRSRGRVRRYNIVQGGRRHAQADDALAAAEGNQTLVDTINALLAG